MEFSPALSFFLAAWTTFIWFTRSLILKHPILCGMHVTRLTDFMSLHASSYKTMRSSKKLFWTFILIARALPLIVLSGQRMTCWFKMRKTTKAWVKPCGHECCCWSLGVFRPVSAADFLVCVTIVLCHELEIPGFLSKMSVSEAQRSIWSSLCLKLHSFVASFSRSQFHFNHNQKDLDFKWCITFSITALALR